MLITFEEQDLVQFKKELQTWAPLNAKQKGGASVPWPWICHTGQLKATHLPVEKFSSVNVLQTLVYLYLSSLGNSIDGYILSQYNQCH